MKFPLSPDQVRRSLDAHSAIGLVVGALMYLICLTGALAALAESFERWEQPGVSEFHQVDDTAIANAVTQYRARVDGKPESLWVVLPTREIPRMHVADDEQEWFTDAQGNLQAAPVEGWTHMLRELHARLHLPAAFGFIVVSALGVMLIALILSGVLAHPRIFRDAFTLRLGGSRRLEQADLHNRLSVWGLPFHLMIAVTGAFYGLVGVLAVAAAAAFFDGDRDALFDAVYGADPVLDAAPVTADPARAMRELRRQAPQAEPLYLVIHHMDSRQQFMEVAARMPGRLAWSEIFRFDAGGTYLGNQGLTAGPTGRQFLYSLYRIHFGTFGPYATRIAWALLGLALTVVSVSGVNIWLSRRGGRDRVDDAWAGLVWGAPLALCLSAFAAVLPALPALTTFCAVLAAAVGLALLRRDPLRSAAELQSLCGLGLLLLSACHWLVHDSAHIDALSHLVNGALCLGALTLLALARNNHRRAAQPQLRRAGATA
ncbi:MAG: hypothetical protein CME59_20510 [Halioglobus sp.]|nr:hypothetical protein [Halioglobus sp.]